MVDRHPDDPAASGWMAGRPRLWRQTIDRHEETEFDAQAERADVERYADPWWPETDHA